VAEDNKEILCHGLCTGRSKVLLCTPNQKVTIYHQMVRDLVENHLLPRFWSISWQIEKPLSCFGGPLQKLIGGNMVDGWSVLGKWRFFMARPILTPFNYFKDCGAMMSVSLANFFLSPNTSQTYL
jgi:hypothetical protein